MEHEHPYCILFVPQQVCPLSFVAEKANGRLPESKVSIKLQPCRQFQVALGMHEGDT
ncbi:MULTISPECIES: hypothetical protein [Eikenella]|uniref:hypothetical protein n=1 Tax=Eikenella TaxID=538 RepID=UPI000AD359C2|nr:MULTISPECIES: hypothetical protein [Eikenella]